jgi:hypothetical protein
VGARCGAHAAAALLARRTDLGCVVLASGLVSLRGVLAERGLSVDVTGNKTAVDPIALVPLHSGYDSLIWGSRAEAGFG